jgi:cytochrome c556
MRALALTLLLLCPIAHATETKPTGQPPASPEQKRTHKKVGKLQKKLAKELKEKAPAEQIGATKAKLQEERTKANAADAVEAAKKPNTAHEQ